jgi:hypothetical protein
MTRGPASWRVDVRSVARASGRVSVVVLLSLIGLGLISLAIVRNVVLG